MMLAIWLTVGVALQPGGSLWDHFLSVADVGRGRLLLLLLDVDGDGRKEIFLAPSATCGNGGCAWYVYAPTSRPKQVRYLGEAGFSPGGFRLTRRSHALTVCWHMSAGDCALGEYRIQRGGISHRSLGTCRSENAGCQAELTRIRRWQMEEGTPLLSADVTENADLTKLEWSQPGGAAAIPATGVPDFNALVMARGPN